MPTLLLKLLTAALVSVVAIECGCASGGAGALAGLGGVPRPQLPAITGAANGAALSVAAPGQSTGPVAPLADTECETQINAARSERRDCVGSHADRCYDNAPADGRDRALCMREALSSCQQSYDKAVEAIVARSCHGNHQLAAR